VTAIALTIAGSDSGGGAGVQADLKTFSALGVFGASAITAITAQNTQGVRAVEDVSPAMIAAQIDAVLDDMAVGAVKIGMVSRAETIRAVAGRLAKRNLRPVLVPLAALVTPNLPEAALLTGTEIAASEAAMTAQARAIVALGADAALVKGGHAGGDEAVDILFDGREVLRLAAPRIATPNTHGTGCTLSAAIAAGLAKGLALHEAVREAKAYLHAALAAGAGLRIGHGSGPVHHFHRWWGA
jgi:hydroxymethylpyrimidine/phosphomethylpyrimidine kinase